MVGEGNISEYRSKMDKTLSSPELKNYEMVQTLVRNQILRSLDSESEEYTESVVEKRSKEVLNFFNMLRSASASEAEGSKSNGELQRSWKVKEDNDEFRVMYREGTAGTPFHSLLVEGYLDGTLDVCQCISCESGLYKKWWPQSAIPTFKILSSQCVKKVRMGEQISLVRYYYKLIASNIFLLITTYSMINCLQERMKLSWPLSSREALVHFFTLEYFEEGLIVVLLNTISDSESIEKNTHGFTRDGIPYAEDVVRIDVVGGFAIQKLTANRSYIRTIANMDIKLDFVPPAFINFVSRQLVGRGFRLYKKEIASVTKGDEKFREALKDPMYTRIHEALYSENKPLAPPPLESSRSSPLDLETVDSGAHDPKILNEIEELEERDHNSRDIITNNEITEEEAENKEIEVVASSNVGQEDFQTTNDVKEHIGHEVEDEVGNISPEVQYALGTLEKAISMLRGYNDNSGDGCSGMIENGHLRENGELSEGDRTIELSKIGLHEPRNDIDNHGSRKTNRSKIVPDEISSHSSVKPTTDVEENHSLDADGNVTRGERVISKGSSKKRRFCCFVAQQE